MSLKLKSGVPLEQLRKFGFAPGDELAQYPAFRDQFEGAGYMLPWWHKFLCDDGQICLSEDEVPLVHAWVDTREGENLLWFDVTPCCTYHAGMGELDLVTDTVFELTKAGLLEPDVQN